MEHLSLYFGDHGKKIEKAVEVANIKEILEKARSQNKEIREIRNLIEDSNLKLKIWEISNTVDKIIETVSKDNSKMKKADTFFEYYLPVTIKILKRYDEIENQRLNSKDSKKFMEEAQRLIDDVDTAFKKQLSSLYQKDIVDADAEMKVFDMMLKAEGLNSNNIDIDKEVK